MRALAVLYCYPPLLVPASMCYAKLVLGLRAAGVELEIMTIAPGSFASPGPTPLDQQLAERMPDDLVVHQSWSPENSLWMRAIKRLDPQRRLSYRWLEPKKREWLIPALRQLQRQDLTRFDLLLTCAQPHANHLVGLELAARAKLPWIAYFSDPWTDSPYQHFGSEAVRAHHRALEDRVLAQADRVLFTCEEMRQLLLSRHPALAAERSGVLPHAFVREWYPPAAPRREGPLRILHTGSFYGPRTPLPLIEALTRLAARQPLAGRLQLDFYGGMDEPYRRAIQKAGLDEIFRVHGFIPYLQTLQKMGEADVLMLIDAPLDAMEESVFLPSKLIDYLGADKPILALTPERGATARVLREVGGVICPLERPAELEAQLGRWLDAGRAARAIDRTAADAYDHRRVGNDLARMMATCIDSRGAVVDSPRALH